MCRTRTETPETPRIRRAQPRASFRNHSPRGGTRAIGIAGRPNRTVATEITIQTPRERKNRTAADGNRGASPGESGVYIPGSEGVECAGSMAPPEPSATAIFYRNLGWLRFVDRFGRKGSQIVD